MKRLKTLDGEFKTHDFAMVEFDEEETLGEEQTVLDNHDDKILLLTERFQRIMADTEATNPPKSTIDPFQFLRRRLHHLESSLRSINLTVELLTPGPDLNACLEWQLEKHGQSHQCRALGSHS